MTPDERVRRQAARQHGLITRAQARALGLSDRQIHTRSTSGGWVRVLPRVYRLPGTPDTFDGRLVSAALWMGDSGHFCGPTAAYIYCLAGVPRPSQITVASHTGITVAGVEVLRLRASDRPRIRRVDGLRVCRAERVIAELAASVPLPQVAATLDDALRRGITTMSSFAGDDWIHRGGRLRSGRETAPGRVRGPQLPS